MKAFINFQFDLKLAHQNIQKVINYCENIKRNILGHLSQINETTLQDKFFEGSAEKLNDFEINYTKRMQKVLNGFYFKKSGTSTNKTFTLTHKYFEGADDVYTYNSSRKTFSITGSAILRMIDRGRKSYQIPIDKDSNKLVWNYGNVKIVWDWKRLHPVIVPSQTSKIYYRGTRFVDYGIQKMAEYVEDKRLKIKKAVP